MKTFSIALVIAVAALPARAQQTNPGSGSYSRSAQHKSKNSAQAKVGGSPTNSPELGPSAEGRAPAYIKAAGDLGQDAKPAVDRPNERPQPTKLSSSTIASPASGTTARIRVDMSLSFPRSQAGRQTDPGFPNTSPRPVPCAQPVRAGGSFRGPARTDRWSIQSGDDTIRVCPPPEAAS